MIMKHILLCENETYGYVKMNLVNENENNIKYLQIVYYMFFCSNGLTTHRSKLLVQVLRSLYL